MAGAILQARLPGIVYGATDPKAGAVETLYQLLNDRRLNHRVDTIGGVLAQESSEILSGFFRSQRAAGQKIRAQARTTIPRKALPTPMQSSDPMERIYARRAAAFERRARRLRQRSDRISHARLGMFLLAVVCIAAIALGSDVPQALLLIAACLAIGFVILIVCYRKVLRAAERYRSLGIINEHALARVRRQWARLPAPTVSAEPDDPPLARDLDLFGRASLVQLLGGGGAMALGRRTLPPLAARARRGRGNRLAANRRGGVGEATWPQAAVHRSRPAPGGRRARDRAVFVVGRRAPVVGKPRMAALGGAPWLPWHWHLRWSRNMWACCRSRCGWGYCCSTSR